LFTQQHSKMEDFISGFGCGVIFTCAFLTWRLGRERRPELRKKMDQALTEHREELDRMRNEFCEQHRAELRKKMDQALTEHRAEFNRMLDEECAEVRKEIEAIRQM
jgi:Sec-independent protein translocase protein TatA